MNTPLFSAYRLNPFGLTANGDFSIIRFPDYDGDGDLDALVSGDLGVRFYRNTGTVASPSLQLEASGRTYDPIFADIDGDGDIDRFESPGTGDTEFYPNTGAGGDPAFGDRVINPYGLTRTRYGATSPVFVDIDGDGDLDLFSGGVYQSSVNFFLNTGSATAPGFSAPTINPFGLTSLAGPVFYSFADVDDDGDLDGFFGDFSGHFFLFENTGNLTAPAFGPVQNNPFGTPGASGFSTPTLVDLDQDGDLDVFSGNEEGGVLFFQNVGNASLPAFQSPYPFGLKPLANYFAKPDLVDIDGDGDLDLFAGDGSGNVRFMRNTGTASAPAFSAPATNRFGLTRVGDSSASPTFADIDSDGDLDAFVGSIDEDIYFFRNTGNATAPAFKPRIKNPFGLTDAGKAPEFADIDADGDLDVFVGTFSGNLVMFENTGSATVPAFSPPVTNPFGFEDVGKVAIPSLCDWDFDGDLDAFVGSLSGDIAFFENTGSALAPAFSRSTLPYFGFENPGGFASITFGDIDSDGDRDAFIGNDAGAIGVFINTTRTQWSKVIQPDAVAFHPTKSVLSIDVPVSAAQFHVSGDATSTTFSFDGKSVTLETALSSISSAHILFDDGSKLLIGDNLPGIQTDFSDNVLSGGAGADYLWGLGGNDLLQGGGAGDWLKGGAGADSLIGGSGNDTYILDSSSDQVTETSLQDVDTVRSFISYTLGALVENLKLLGASHGTGNAGDNVLTGNALDNRLSGKSGEDVLSGCGGVRDLGVGSIDTLAGGLGADRFILGNASHVFYNNGQPGNGRADYALITDFHASDRLQLHGSAELYVLGAYDASAQTQNLYLDNGGLGSEDELIAIVHTDAAVDLQLARFR